jgi:hypothetical protein
VFYPDAILWRMTPIVLLGLFVLLFGAIVWPRLFLPGRVRAPLLTIAAFAVLYAGLMDAGAKKFDRYILPVFPVMDLLAAVGFVGLARVLWQARHLRRQLLATGAVVVILGAQLGAAWSDRAYGFDYYTPLRGGIASAQHEMQLGWGEGMDQVAAFILARPDGATATIRTQNNNVTLLYLMPSTVTVLNSNIRGGPLGIDQWATTDYYVSYLPQWERDLNRVMQDQAAATPPLDTVTIDGVAFASVYDLRMIPPPPALVDSLSCRWTFGDALTLLTYRDVSTRASRSDPNLRRLDLHFQPGAGFTGDHTVRVRLVPRGDEVEPIKVETVLAPAAVPGAIATASVAFSLPRGRTTNSYDIEVTVVDPSTGDALPAQLLDSDSPPGDTAIANACDGAGVVDKASQRTGVTRTASGLSAGRVVGPALADIPGPR